MYNPYLEISVKTENLNFSNYPRSWQTISMMMPACTLRSGFMRALLMAMRLEEGGVLHAGPPCSSFVFINAFTHGRTKQRPLGYQRLRWYVRQANLKLVSMNFNGFVIEFLSNPCQTSVR